MAKTGIAWTQRTWNPFRGCSRVSPGCEHCYAETVAHRFKKPGEAFEGLTTNGRWNGTVAAAPHKFWEPFAWKKPQRVFVNSMSDLFHQKIALDDLAEVFMAMAMNEHLTFQALTKRPEYMRAVLTDPKFWLRVGSLCEQYAEREEKLNSGQLMGFDAWAEGILGKQRLPNLHLGVSVEDQKYTSRIDALLGTPAAVRWISAEPLLGPLDLTSLPANLAGLSGDPEPWDWYNSLTGHGEGPNPEFSEEPVFPSLDWVVVGGESGHGARPCHVLWVRSIVDQCLETSTPVFVKQLGRYPVQRRNEKSGPSAVLEQGKIDREWPLATRFGNRTGDVELNGRVAILKSQAGADPTEWPDTLRWREYPTEVAANAQ